MCQALWFRGWRTADGDDHRCRGGCGTALDDVTLTEEQALRYHAKVIQDVVRMLCAGLIHGDLSEFNVLVDADGPVIIDLPQAVDAAGNNSAAAMLERDVNNMRAYFGRFAPEPLPITVKRCGRCMKRGSCIPIATDRPLRVR